MIKLNELYIGKFRGISDLALKGFGNLTLIVGDNNVGKTTILEAIKCFENPNDIYSLILCGRLRTKNMALSRRVSLFDSFVSLFPYRQNDKSIELSAIIDEKQHSLKVQGEIEKRLVSNKTTNNADFIEEDLNKINIEQTQMEFEQEIEFFSGDIMYDNECKRFEIPSERMNMPIISFRNGERIDYISPFDQAPAYITEKTLPFKNDIVKLLQLFDPDITSFDLARDDKRGNVVTEWIRHKKLNTVPLYTFGDGLKHALSMATYLSRIQGGILLIDEIETSMHVSILPRIFQWILTASKKLNIQVIATTHSLEAVEAFSKLAVGDTQQELVLFRTEKYNDKYYSKRYSESQLDEIVMQHGLDVR